MAMLMTLKYVVGMFLVLFVAWQIIAPLMFGQPPFPAFRKEKKHAKK